MPSFGAKFIFIGAALTASPAASQPSYRIELASAEPNVAHFLMSLPREEALPLVLSKEEDLPSSAPACGATPLRQTSPRTWLKPAGCSVVNWNASIESRDSAEFDASNPTSLWMSHDRTWLLTSSLPWLRAADMQGLPVQIISRVGSRKMLVRSRGPSKGEIPVYIPVGQPARLFKADGFTVACYGAVPAGAVLDRLQLSLAATLSQWWKDIPPVSAVHPDHFNFVWFGPSQGSAPGVFASAGSDALLIQYVPDPKTGNSKAKLEAAVFGVGAHEALHSLFESVPGFGKKWATWAGESLPTYFAYKVAHRHLRGASLAIFRSEIVNQRSDKALLTIEEKTDAGDESQYDGFYGRGARFWFALEKVLTIAPNRSGRLAALIQHTNGMEGMNWRDATSIASYLDRYSNNKAGPIVRCFLVDDNCELANQPIG